MPTTIYEESRDVDLSRSGAQVTRVFRVEPYADGVVVGHRLLGGVQLLGGRLVRFLPARDPVLPWCWCESVKIAGGGTFGPYQASGFTILGAQNVYDWARLTAVYKTPDIDQPTLDKVGGGGGPNGDTAGNSGTAAQDEIDIASESYDFGAQQLTLPNDRYQWANTSNNKLLSATNTGAVKTFPKLDFQLTRHLVARKPTKAIRDMMGRVNFSSFRVLDDTYPPETLRFDGAAATRKITNQGVKFYEIVYKWAVQPIYDVVETGQKDYVGWNRLYNPDAGKWDYVRTASGGVKPYLYDTDAPSQNGVASLALLFDPRSI